MRELALVDCGLQQPECLAVAHVLLKNDALELVDVRDNNIQDMMDISDILRLGCKPTCTLQL